jgi:glycerate kinase
LAAIGAKLVSGFDLVADLVGLDEAIARSDLVITGEGRLDRTSTAGKVVGELARRCADGPPLWCLVGSVDESVDARLLYNAQVVALADRFGTDLAMSDPLACFAVATREAIDAFEASHRTPTAG